MYSISAYHPSMHVGTHAYTYACTMRTLCGILSCIFRQTHTYTHMHMHTHSQQEPCATSTCMRATDTHTHSLIHTNTRTTNEPHPSTYKSCTQDTAQKIIVDYVLHDTQKHSSYT